MKKIIVTVLALLMLSACTTIQVQEKVEQAEQKVAETKEVVQTEVKEVAGQLSTLLAKDIQAVDCSNCQTSIEKDDRSLTLNALPTNVYEEALMKLFEARTTRDFETLAKIDLNRHYGDTAADYEKNFLAEEKNPVQTVVIQSFETAKPEEVLERYGNLDLDKHLLDLGKVAELSFVKIKYEETTEDGNSKTKEEYFVVTKDKDTGELQIQGSYGAGETK